MGTIDAKELLQLWKVEDLPIEMAVGHLLQHLVLLHGADDDTAGRCTKLERAMDAQNINWANLKLDVDALLKQANIKSQQEPSTRKKRKYKRRKKTE